jgi:hypothetical protein
MLQRSVFQIAEGMAEALAYLRDPLSADPLSADQPNRFGAASHGSDRRTVPILSRASGR